MGNQIQPYHQIKFMYVMNGYLCTVNIKNIKYNNDLLFRDLFLQTRSPCVCVSRHFFFFFYYFFYTLFSLDQIRINQVSLCCLDYIRLPLGTQKVGLVSPTFLCYLLKFDCLLIEVDGLLQLSVRRQGPAHTHMHTHTCAHTHTLAE